MHRTFLAFAISCLGKFLPGLRKRAQGRMLDPPHPALLLRGVSDAVGVTLTMRDRNGVAYVSVDIARQPVSIQASPVQDGANSDSIGHAHEAFHGTGRG